MTAASPEFWSHANEEFQQNLAKSWSQAMQTFQTMDLGGIVTGAEGLASPLFRGGLCLVEPWHVVQA